MDAPQTAHTRGLSCTNCRHRKVRCNRSLPTCQRCTSMQLTCRYPERRPRTVKRRPHIGDQDALSEILQRLRRVEEHTSRKSSSPGSSASPAVFTDNQSSTGRPSETSGDSHACEACGHISQTSSSKRGISNFFPPLTTPSPYFGRGTEEPADLTSILESSIYQVRQIRKRRDASAIDITNKSMAIPPDLARKWIKLAGTQIQGTLFQGILDHKLMNMMPDLMEMRNVQVDASIVLIYYCSLWQGSFFNDPKTCSMQQPDYTNQLFLCCLRAIAAWQAEATGTPMDFVAAMFMTMTAAENLDFELSWEMHKRACEYALDLDLHNLDNVDKASLMGLMMTDNDRAALWSLIQLDLVHRLLNNRTAAFHVDLENWCVNMPWLTADAPPDAVLTVVFLAQSRLTFILMDFFKAIENLEDFSTALSVITPFCEAVEAVFQEWNVKDWLFDYSSNDDDTAMLGDLALTGDACILFMLRKATMPGTDERKPSSFDSDDMIPRTAISMRASRRLLRCLHHLLQDKGAPGPQLLASSLGMHRMHIAYAHLAHGIIEEPAGPDVGEDVLLLRRVTEVVVEVSKKEAAFKPLVNGLKTVNAEVERWVLMGEGIAMDSSME